MPAMPSMNPLAARTVAARLSILRPRCCRFSVSAQAASLSRGRRRNHAPPADEVVDVAKLLENPHWSVASLLPERQRATTETGSGGSAGDGEGSEVTPAQLRHLLRLSALPPPASAEEQAEMLSTLHTQLHFVRDIQGVDTRGVQPLHAIRDETEASLREQTIGVKEVEQTLLQEEAFGHNRRPRRRRSDEVDTAGAEDWDALAMAPRTAGRYIVVDGAEQ